MSRSRFASASFSAALLCVALLPGSAPAATVTIGEAVGTNGCTSGSTFVQDSTASGTAGYTVPASGQIVGWSHDAGPGIGSKLRLKVFRRTADPAVFLVVGESASEALEPNELNEFLLSSPIDVTAGDLLGLTVPADSAEQPRCANNTSSTGNGARFLSGDPAPGTSPTFASPSPGQRLNISATLVAEGFEPPPPPPTTPATPSPDSSLTTGIEDAACTKLRKKLKKAKRKDRKKKVRKLRRKLRRLGC